MVNYTVLPGDTLWGIAKKNGIELNELINANPSLSNTDYILPGQIITIPSTKKESHKVMLGDTLWSIATKNGISVDDLMKANPNITNPALVFPGQTINIPSAPTQVDDISALEKEVIRLVNVERAKAGRSALSENKELSRVARIKSNDFINNNYFSHNSPTYGTPFEMLKKFGISYTAAAENIARGQGTAINVMNTWMNSSGHRANILDSTYNQIGVGVAKDNKGTLYWTQLFIRS